MKSSLIVITFILFAITPIMSIAAKAPIEIKQSSFVLSSEAQIFTEKYHANDLIDDSYFISTLDMILTSDLNELSKVDAFMIILDKIGWLFNGTMKLFPERNYFETYTGTIATYLKYQKALEPLEYDINKLLAITQPSSNASVIQRANALLLATIVNRQASISQIYALCNSEVINSSDVPAIMLHSISMSVVLARDAQLAHRLLAIIPSISIEEGREDILCSAGIYSVPEIIDSIRKYVRNNYVSSFDCSIQTGLIIIQKRSLKDDFISFLEELSTIDHEKVRAKDISEFKSSNFRGPLESLPGERVYTKTWDNFNITFYDDGTLVTYGDFSHFRSFNKK
jgi:hypothetical protein